MPREYFPPGTRRRVIGLRQEGRKPAEVRELPGVSVRTQSTWLRQEGLSRSQVWGQETVERCRELRGMGYSYEEIRRVTGVPVNTQRTWYSPELLAIHDRRPKKPILIEGLREVTHKGLRYKLGRHGRLFYQDELGEWVRSTLSPEDVGFRSAAQAS